MYVRAHSLTLPSLHLRHSTFYNSSVASPTSQALHLRHLASHPRMRLCSFSNPSVASTLSQLNLQPFRRFTYVTAFSTTLLWLHLRHRPISYVTWRAAHGRGFAHSPTLPTLHLRSQFILHAFHCFTYVTAYSQTLLSLHLHQWMRLCSFHNPAAASPTSQFIHQSISCFTYVTAHSLTLPSLHLHHTLFFNPFIVSPMSQTLHLLHLASRLWMRLCSFSNPLVASLMLQLILQPLHCFTYVTAHSPTLPSLQLRHSPFSNPSVASPTSQIILKPFRRFTYVTVHSQTLPSLHLRRSSFTNPFVASATSQPILQPFCRFTYVTGTSSMSAGKLSMQQWIIIKWVVDIARLYFRILFLIISL